MKTVSTSQQIVTRVTTTQDAAELARLNAVFNNVHDPPEAIAARLADLHRVETPILAEVDGHAVGFAALRLAPCVFYTRPYAELTELFVEASYRRQGVGHALITHVEQLARESGAVGLALLTGLDNAGAQAFYRAHGYAGIDLGMIKKL